MVVKTKCDVSSVAQVDNCANNRSTKGAESVEVDTPSDVDRVGDVAEEQTRFPSTK